MGTVTKEHLMVAIDKTISKFTLASLLVHSFVGAACTVAGVNYMLDVLYFQSTTIFGHTTVAFNLPSFFSTLLIVLSIGGGLSMLYHAKKLWTTYKSI